MEVMTPFLEGRDVVVEAGGDAFRLCYQCGTCTATCPWNRVREFNVRQAMHEAALGLLDIEGEKTWLCVTCNACVERCPRGVKIIDVWVAARRLLGEMGAFPADLKSTIGTLRAEGSPYGPREKRTEWLEKHNLPRFDGTQEFLLFVCCASIYDAKAEPMALALAKLLDAAGVSFGVLGEEVVCCGEAARKCGAEELFLSLAEKNINAFKKSGAKKVLTVSPHCFWTFRNEYPEFGADFQTIHYTQLLATLIDEGKLSIKGGNGRVAFHDPCYLGRHSGLYDDARKVLQKAGYELAVMGEEREDALCCGGGGGRIWMETKKGERFSDIRVTQAAEADASVLAVACPYCYMNIADSIITEGKEESMRCADVAELLKELL